MKRRVEQRWTFAVAAGALAMAACSAPTTEALEGSTTTSVEETTSTSSTTSSTTTTTEAATTTTQLEGGTLENPLPVGDPLLSGFTYSDFGGDWEGFVGGLVETGPGQFNDEEGRCLVLVGTLTPTQIQDGAVSSGFNTPGLSLIVGGALVDNEVNECDVDAIEAAGYGWILNAEVTVGTTYPFYAEFFLPGESPAEPEVIVLGSPTGSDALFYQPTVLDTIPEPNVAGTTSGADDREVLPVGDPLLSGFTYSDFGGDWEGFVGGLVETGPGQFNDEEGRCLVLVGTLTPTQIQDGAVSSGFNTPGLSLIVGGALVDNEVNECDVDAIEAAGYGWILNAEVTVGTTYPFYAEFFLPGESPAEPEVIVLGSPTGSDALFYQPTVLDTIPEP